MAQTGTPRTKFLVPSIGSITQRRGADACRAELLAGDRVVADDRAASRSRIACLDGAVGVADRGQVGFGLDDQIGGAEAGEGDRVGGVGQLERREGEVGRRGRRPRHRTQSGRLPSGA